MDSEVQNSVAFLLDLALIIASALVVIDTFRK